MKRHLEKVATYKQGGGPGTDLSFPAFTGNQPYQHFKFVLLDSGTMRQPISVCKPPSLWHFVTAAPGN